MKSVLSEIRQLLEAALVSALDETGRGVDPLVRAAGDPRFGDYQSNVAMGLAKQLGEKPRDIAQKIVNALPPDAADMLDPPEVAGPGFINLRLRRDCLIKTLSSIPPAPAGDESADRMGIETCDATERRHVVVDYSSPNVAKEMHVGHLRSTVIGDVIARVLGFQGHEVIRQNHLGDWGTQFGKVILALWHLYMGRRQNETADDLEQIGRRLAVMPADEAEQLLAERCRIHQDNLEHDPDGRLFHAFIRDFEPSFELLLPAYRYVNAIEEAAAGKDLFITDPTSKDPYPFSSVSRHVAAMLQGKAGVDNEQEITAWRKAKEATLRECNAIYRRLGVLLDDGDVRGESFYNPLLSAVIEELKRSLATPRAAPSGMRAVCRKDQGAICVFLETADGAPAFKGPQGGPLPMIVQKSDGASLYATTDLAGVLFRVAHSERNPVKFQSQALARQLMALGGGLGSDRVIYVVGAPQKLHFEMLFPTVDALGWTQGKQRRTELEHVAFGSVLGEDRKILRTRAGETVKLKDLLAEAVDRAEALVRETEADPSKRRGFADDEIRHIAETVGIASVKYADLSQNRNTDYVFSWDKMLALQGNTAPYMLYAYARIRSIERKGIEAGTIGEGAETAPIRLEHETERALALRLLQLPEMIDAVGASLYPHLLCDYLYELAGAFMKFYEACPVLQAKAPETAASRWRLCGLTARGLRLGLGLLGIHTLERM